MENSNSHLNSVKPDSTRANSDVKRIFSGLLYPLDSTNKNLLTGITQDEPTECSNTPFFSQTASWDNKNLI